MADEIIPRSGIYCIRNITSGRVYVGSASKIKARWSNHRSLLRRGKHHSPILQKSWSKHGENAFVFEVLEAIPIGGALIAREQFWMDKLHSGCAIRGFNASPTAGFQTLINMSRSRKGEKRPPFTAEHRARIAAARAGTKASAETKAKMSATRLGRKLGPQSAAHKAKLGALKKGRPNPAIAASNRRRAKGDGRGQLKLPI